MKVVRMMAAGQGDIIIRYVTEEVFKNFEDNAKPGDHVNEWFFELGDSEDLLEDFWSSAAERAFLRNNPDLEIVEDIEGLYIY